MDEQAKKRKRNDKNRRRQEKKREKKAALYNRLGGSASGKKSQDQVNGNGTSNVVGSSSSSSSSSSLGLKKAKKAKVFEKNKVEKVFEHANGDLKEAGEKVFSWMIAPTQLDSFFKDFYQEKPLLLKRNGQTNYFDGLLSLPMIEDMLKQRKLRYTRDFSITSYKNGKRTTLKDDTEDIANHGTVMKLFKEQDCSIRLLRPHEHSDLLWKLMASLEAFFGCGGGSNSYLTPKGSQGFAPHYDDIDAFIIQVEGKKHWTVYEHFGEKKKKSKKKAKDDDKKEIADMGDFVEDSDEEDDPQDLFPRYPRYSSKDFTQEQVKRNLKVAIQTTLEPGDFLYVPRGMVHQARSHPDEHSLHITISTGQRNTFADFIREALPMALERACNKDTTHDCAELRKNLPMDMSEFMGIIHSDNEKDPRRQEFMTNIVKMVTNSVLNHMDLDFTADRMYAKFQHDRHQPVGILREPFEGVEDAVIGLKTKIALVAKGIATLTVEGNAAIVYHSCANTRVYHETDTTGLEFDLEDAEMIEAVLKSDPTVPSAVSEFPHMLGDADKVRVVTFLYEQNIVRVVE